MHYKSGSPYQAWSVSWALIFSACSADRLSAPITRADLVPDFVPVISRPIVRSAVTNVQGIMASSSLSVGDTVSYVSLVPGSIPGVKSITITNMRSGVTITGALKDGGLDPVPIPASIGDTLKFVAVDGAGALRITVAAVRSVSALSIVRTNPARGHASIPLNTSIQVVFSEPVAPATATNQNIFVRRGADPLDGAVVASADGISVEFRPSLPLITGEQYTLVVTTGLTDRAGNHLARTTEVPFTIWAGGNGIVFMSTRTGNGEIFFMKPDGSGVVNLTNNPAADGDPAWSPDGTQIAFDSNRNGTSHIFLMQSDGSGVRELTSGTTFDTSPSWSPDGTMIVFGRCCTSGLSDLFIIRTDGTQLKKITSGDGYAENPAWSPDGSRIAFDYAVGGLRPDIYLIQPDGMGLTRVTTDPHTDKYPAWTPDGKWLSFSTDRVDNALTIWFSKPDGSGAYLCDELGTRAVGVTYSSYDSTATIFTSNVNGSDNIFLLNGSGVTGSGVTSTGLHNLTNNSFENRSPSWSRK